MVLCECWDISFEISFDNCLYSFVSCVLCVSGVRALFHVLFHEQLQLKAKAKRKKKSFQFLFFHLLYFRFCLSIFCSDEILFFIKLILLLLTVHETHKKKRKVFFLKKNSVDAKNITSITGSEKYSEDI